METAEVVMTSSLAENLAIIASLLTAVGTIFTQWKKIIEWVRGLRPGLRSHIIWGTVMATTWLLFLLQTNEKGDGGGPLAVAQSDSTMITVSGKGVRVSELPQFVIRLADSVNDKNTALKSAQRQLSMKDSLLKQNQQKLRTDSLALRKIESKVKEVRQQKDDLKDQISKLKQNQSIKRFFADLRAVRSCKILIFTSAQAHLLRQSVESKLQEVGFTIGDGARLAPTESHILYYHRGREQLAQELQKFFAEYYSIELAPKFEENSVQARLIKISLK